MDNENSNVRESPIACDTLHITDAESGVKRRVPNYFCNFTCDICKMRSSLHQMMEVYFEPDIMIQII